MRLKLLIFGVLLSFLSNAQKGDKWDHLTIEIKTDKPDKPARTDKPGNPGNNDRNPSGNNSNNNSLQTGSESVQLSGVSQLHINRILSLVRLSNISIKLWKLFTEPRSMNSAIIKAYLWEDWTDFDGEIGKLPESSKQILLGVAIDADFDIQTAIQDAKAKGQDITGLKAELELWKKIEDRTTKQIQNKDWYGDRRLSSVQTSFYNISVGANYNANSGNARGILIQPNFTVAHSEDLPVKAMVYFYNENGNALLDRNRQYSAGNGGVAMGIDLLPCCNYSLFDGTSSNLLFIPYNELEIDGRPGERYDLKYFIAFFAHGEQITSTDFFHFSLSY